MRLLALSLVAFIALRLVPAFAQAVPSQAERALAVARMADDPAAAEPVLEAASAVDTVGKLDLILFLHAIPPASSQRRDRIEALVDEVSALVDQAKESHDLVGAFALKSYDGSDASLIPLIVRASAASLADIRVPHAVFGWGTIAYAIPCPVLLARPALYKATMPLSGNANDRVLPVSGCSYGRGTVHGFPQAAIDRFREASRLATPPDDDAPLSGRDFGATLRNWVCEGLQVGAPVEAPGFLDSYRLKNPTAFERYLDHPEVKPSFEEAQALLVAHYAGLGMEPRVASRRAKLGLLFLAHEN